MEINTQQTQPTAQIPQEQSFQPSGNKSRKYVWLFITGITVIVLGAGVAMVLSQLNSERQLTLTVYADNNHNGIKDMGEELVPGATLAVLSEDGTVQGEKVSGENGLAVLDKLLAYNKKSIFSYSKNIVSIQTRATPQCFGAAKAELKFSFDFWGNGNVDVPLFYSCIKTEAFYDFNANGKRDADEAGAPDVSIELSPTNNTDAPIVRATDANGQAQFENLSDTEYSASVAMPKYFEITTPKQPNLRPGKEQKILVGMNCRWCISGKVFLDTNNDIKLDLGEKGIGNILISLSTPWHSELKSYTDANGNYVFGDLSDAYQKGITGYHIVAHILGNDPLYEFKKAGMEQYDVDIPPAHRIDFPLKTKSEDYTVRVKIYKDLNSNGIKDGNDSWLSGVWVGVGRGFNQTDQNGEFTIKFQPILAGQTYGNLVIQLPPEYEAAPYLGMFMDGTYINTLVNMVPQPQEFTIIAQPRKTALPSPSPSDTFTVSGSVFVDANGNGKKDNDEQTISASNGQPINITLVNMGNRRIGSGGGVFPASQIYQAVNGSFSIRQFDANATESGKVELLKPGIYSIGIDNLPSGYRPTTATTKYFDLLSNETIDFGIQKIAQ